VPPPSVPRLKNLSNVRFGRLTRRFDEERGRAILSVMDRAGLDMEPEERLAIVRGAKERDLAHSGLADTMIDSFHQVGSGQLPSVCGERRAVSCASLPISTKAHVPCLPTFPPCADQMIDERRRIDAEADAKGRPRSRTSLRLAAMRLAINKVANVEMKRGSILGG
jgi:hypothetical protein